MNWGKEINPMHDLCISERNIFVAAKTCHVSTKEINESFAFVQKTDNVLRGLRVMEICSGHGLIGHMLLDKYIAKTVTQLDLIRPRAARELDSIMNHHSRLYFNIMDVFLHDVNRFNGEIDAIIACHPCGSLTDRAIELGIQFNVRTIAVMPCCHGKVTNAGMIKSFAKSLGTPIRDALELNRMIKMQNAGYTVTCRHIPVGITPENRILIAQMPRHT